MKISYNWLKETVGFDLSPTELAEKLAQAGSQVESIAPLAPEITGVVVAELTEVKRHPNADRLSVTTVNDGEQIYTVVCGADNIAVGDRVPLAKVGAVLPGNFKIKQSKIRGETSQGMLCSAAELELPVLQDRDGILQLPLTAPLGADLNEYLGLRDCILDIELTADRGDLLSLRGLAAEIGALLGKPFSLTGPAAPAATGSLPIAIETPACSLYSGRLIEGVRVGPSPLWLQLRLLACGQRPVNNIVDSANIVMLEWGQPLHTFDADKLPAPEITVRQARAGEEIVSLDGKERLLDPSMMLITSGGRPVAIAGVMGSLDSEVDGKTKNLLLESAVFDAISVRKTAKALGLSSEAGSRYEKGVDPSIALVASERAAALIAELAGGKVQGIALAGSDRPAVWSIPVSIDRINGLLGTNIARAKAIRLLELLGLTVEDGGEQLTVHVSDRRRDLRVWQDIAEEVGRLYGFEHVPATLPTGEMTLGVRTERQSLHWQIRELLAGCGLQEALTYSFISPEAAEKSLAEPGVPLANPLTREASVMRGSMLPSLLAAVAYNFAHGQESVALFELANIYRPGKPLPVQTTRIVGALAGKEPNHWQRPGQAYDFYAAKGVVEQLLASLGCGADIRYAGHRQYHPGRSAAVYAKDACLGYLGQIHPAISSAWKLGEVYAFDLDFDAVAGAVQQAKRFRAPSRYPAIHRDLAVETSGETAAGDLLAVIAESAGELLEQLDCFDVYTGDSLTAKGKSLAFSLTFRHPERTLAEKEIQKLIAAIVCQLEANGAFLRR